jgi:hypothetical protein
LARSLWAEVIHSERDAPKPPPADDPRAAPIPAGGPIPAALKILAELDFVKAQLAQRRAATLLDHGQGIAQRFDCHRAV